MCCEEWAKKKRKAKILCACVRLCVPSIENLVTSFILLALSFPPAPAGWLAVCLRACLPRLESYLIPVFRFSLLRGRFINLFVRACVCPHVLVIGWLGAFFLHTFFLPLRFHIGILLSFYPHHSHHDNLIQCFIALILFNTNPPFLFTTNVCGCLCSF